MQQIIIDEPAHRDIYQAELVLVRPDTHVAWRGSNAVFDINELKRIWARLLGWEIEQ